MKSNRQKTILSKRRSRSCNENIVSVSGSTGASVPTASCRTVRPEKGTHPYSGPPTTSEKSSVGAGMFISQPYARGRA